MTAMTDERIEAIELADKILQAAGSGLRHYMPSSKERIVDEAEKAIKALRAKDTRKTPDQLTNERIVQIGVISGFMLSTAHGQDTKKLMPVSDASTLVNFGRMLISEVK